MEDNVSGDIEKTKSAWEGLSTSIFENNNESLRDFIQSITNIISKVTQWTEQNPELIATISKVAAGIIALTVVGGTAAIALAGILLPIKMILPALKLLPAALGIVKAAFVALKVVVITNPVLAVVAALATAVYAIYDNWGNTGNFFKDMWTGIHLAFLKGIQILTALILDSILPDSWGIDSDVLSKQIKDIEKATNIAKDIEPITQKIDTTATQRIIHDNAQKQPNSKVDVSVKIDSQAPATVEKVKTTGISNINLDVGNFATAGF